MSGAIVCESGTHCIGTTPIRERIERFYASSLDRSIEFFKPLPRDLAVKNLVAYLERLERLLTGKTWVESKYYADAEFGSVKTELKGLPPNTVDCLTCVFFRVGSHRYTRSHFEGFAKVFALKFLPGVDESASKRQKI